MDRERTNQDNAQSILSFGGVSRRNFLKGGVLATASVIGAGAAAGLLAGCDSGDKQAVLGKASTAQTEPIDVYNTDVLVIGGGLSGAQVALRALDLNADVTIVDKGPFQFSGAAGYNWDILLGHSSLGLAFEVGISDTYDLRNPEIWEALSAYEEKVPNRLVSYAQQGGTTFHRKPDGSILYYLDIPEYSMTDKGFMRYATDRLRDLSVSIIDQTMVTDLIVEEGICRGVVGIHIPTGAIRAIRAKAVIKCTGGSTQTYGWVSVSPITLNTPDNTGDVDVAAYRHGCELLDNEFYKWDLITMYPEGIAGAFNSGLGADVVDYGHISDVDGDYFMKDIPQAEMTRPRFAQEVSKRIYEGKAGSNGGVFMDMSEESLAKLRPSYSRNAQLWKERFDIDVTTSKIELGLECFEHSGVPRVDVNLMSAIEGFFDVRGGGTAGEEAAISGFRSYQQGPYVAEKAVEYMKALDNGAALFDVSVLQPEVERLLEIKDREVANGLRPHELRRLIQSACFEALGPIREAESMQAGLAELERIEAEDMQRQYVKNKTRVFNTEWRDAIENENLLVLALAAVRASLMREETRGEMTRADFPEKSEDWAKKNIAVSLVDGEMLVEATEVGVVPVLK